MSIQREDEPGRALSWPEVERGIVDYRGVINSWWEAMPVEIRRAFYNDPLVHRVIVESARAGQSTEQMLWRLTQELFRAMRHREDQLIRLIECSPLHPSELL